VTPRSADRLGPYLLEGILGQGGMGTVYRAVDERLGRRVALKVIRLDGAGASHVSADALRREAALAARIVHPHLITIFAFEELDGNGVIAMELGVGHPLSSRVGTPWPWRAAAGVLLAVARGVGAAHAAGVLHLDLKPANVLVDDAGGVKVLDFGIARPMTAAPDAAQGIGTPGYMAPEQFHGTALGPATDVFAIGAIGYELITGRRAFGRGSAAEVAARVVQHDPPGLETAERARQRCGPLGPVLRRALQKRATDRYRDAGAFVHALEALLEGVVDSGWTYVPTSPTPTATPVVGSDPVAAAPAAPPSASPTRSRPRRMPLVLGVGAALALAVLATALDSSLAPRPTRQGGGASAGLAVEPDAAQRAAQRLSAEAEAAAREDSARRAAAARDSAARDSARADSLRRVAAAAATRPAVALGTIRGSVRSPLGPESARVVIRPRRGSVRTVVTDADGSFVVPRLPTGDAAIEVELLDARGRDVASQRVDQVVAANGDHTVDFEFAAPPLPAPVAVPRIAAAQTGSLIGTLTEWPATIRLSTGHVVQTDRNGTFHIQNLPTGRVGISVTWAAHANAEPQRSEVIIEPGRIRAVQIVRRPTDGSASGAGSAAAMDAATLAALRQQLEVQWPTVLASAGPSEFQRFLRGSRPTSRLDSVSVNPEQSADAAVAVAHMRFEWVAASGDRRVSRASVLVAASRRSAAAPWQFADARLTSRPFW
jgi:hypothetical protein